MARPSSDSGDPRRPAAGNLHRLSLKLGVAFAAMAILISALLTFGLYRITVDWLREGLRQRIRDAVAIGAGRLDGDAFIPLADPAQESDPAFIRLRDELRRIRDAGSGFRFVYTVRRSADGGIIFVVDAEEDPAQVSHLGDHYDDAGPVLESHIDTLTGALVEEDFYTDRWGTWLTGYAPVPAADGRPSVVLCMDVAAETVLSRERSFLRTALVVFGVSLPLSLVVGGFLGRRLAKPIVALTRGAERITGGDLEHVVEVSGRDETAELATAFNTMTGKLSCSLDELRRSEEELTRHRDHLEVLVRERTSRLTAANERMNEDLKSAARVQQAFLPQRPPDLPGVRFAWNYTPCEELAGDMLGISELGQGRVAMWVADVCGHGVAAALVAVTVSRLLSTLGDSEAAARRQAGGPGEGGSRCPADVARFLNQRFPWDPETMRFFTFLFGILDLETREFRYVSAGHPGPLLVVAAGGTRILPTSPPAIGFFPDPDFIEHSVTLEPGDRMFLFSDGITETENQSGDEFGESRLADTLARHRADSLDEAVEFLIAALIIWRGRSNPDDDLSLLAVEIDEAAE